MAVSAVILVLVVTVKLAFPDVMEKYRQQALKVAGHFMDDHAGYVQYFEQLAGVVVKSDEAAD